MDNSSFPSPGVMRLEVLRDDDLVARRAAAIMVMEAEAAVRLRGRFVMAISGGRSPWAMLRALGALDMPWPNTHILQVDERIAPANHPDRNLTQLIATLAPFVRPGAPRIDPMPVEGREIGEASLRYARTLVEAAGSPPVLDLVHLGLGADGHTASLVPGDAALAVNDVDVTVTAPYQGRRRMTLTYPAINRARRILWVVTGPDKRAMLVRLLQGDKTIPAGLVRRQDALVLADFEAAPSAELFTED